MENDLKLERFAVISSKVVDETTIKLEMETTSCSSGSMWYYVTANKANSFRSKSVAFTDLKIATKVYNLCGFAIDKNRKED